MAATLRHYPHFPASNRKTLSSPNSLLQKIFEKPNSIPCSPVHYLPAAARPIAMKNTSSMKIPQQPFHLAYYQIWD
ncbi:hypothetical protein TNCV_313731 [Trichonephila clavipes]|nr:hypothetical protein TNCV_313731 [Trichonephila clavipes]